MVNSSWRLWFSSCSCRMHWESIVVDRRSAREHLRMFADAWMNSTKTLPWLAWITWLLDFYVLISWGFVFIFSLKQLLIANIVISRGRPSKGGWHGISQSIFVIIPRPKIIRSFAFVDFWWWWWWLFFCYLRQICLSRITSAMHLFFHLLMFISLPWWWHAVSTSV